MLEVTKKEQKLFESFKRGEERGFNFLFTEHYTPLTYFAYKLLGNKVAAEDVVEDCFVKLWEKRHIISQAGSIKSWLYTTVKNASIDIVRKEKRKKTHHHEMTHLADISEQSIMNKMIETELIRLLILAKGKLPPKAKLVFEKFYLENMSYQEIAEQMNISIHTVKNQKVRAIRILKKQFPYLMVFLSLLENQKLD